MAAANYTMMNESTGVSLGHSPTFTSIDGLTSAQWLKLSYVIIFGLSSFAGVLGNITIIWAFIASRSLRCLRNAFIINLTIADLTVASVTMPMSIIGALAGRTWFDDKYHLCVLSAIVCAPGCVATTYSIFAVAAGRYYYVCQYRLYLKYFTKPLMICYITLIWIISFGIHLPNHLGWGRVQYSSHFQFCTFDSDHKTYPLAYASALFAAIILTAVYYCKMYLRIRRSHLPRQLILGLKGNEQRALVMHYLNSGSNKKWQYSTVTVETGLDTTQKMSTAVESMNEYDEMTTSCFDGILGNVAAQRKKLKEELRLINASFKIFVVFLIFWCPVVVVILFFRDQKMNVPEAVYLFTALMAHSNSTCNVFIYYLANQAFRKYVNSFFCMFGKCIWLIG